MPSVAPNDSRKPGSKIAVGEDASPTVAATARILIDGALNSSSRPPRKRTAAEIARSTDGAGPVIWP